jgi:hypothetical protein
MVWLQSLTDLQASQREMDGVALKARTGEFVEQWEFARFYAIRKNGTEARQKRYPAGR